MISFPALVVPGVAVLGLCTSASSAQQLLWQRDLASESYYWLDEFGDLDHDSYEDLLCLCYSNFGTLQQVPLARVLSGHTGAVLHDHIVQGQLWNLQGI